MEELSKESLSNEALYVNTSESLFLVKPDSGENLTEVPIPPHVLTYAQLKVAYQRKGHASRFVQAYQESVGHDPSDAKIARHIEFQGR